jgi:undecaprenyl-diphosphatase
MALGLFGHNGHGRKLILRLVISAAPAALVGFFVDGIVQKTLYNASVVAIALAVGGVIILLVEASYVKKSPRNFAKRYCTIESLSVGQSLTIGMWQCLALIPGISRSMATIVSGYWCGLRRAEAAEYSFLLGAVVSSAAVAYKLAKDFDVLWLCIGAKTFLLGTAVAFIASAIAIKAFVAFISHYGIVLFGYYRIFLALFVFLLLP